MAYFERSYVTIQWDDDLGGVVAEWEGFVKGENFREAMNAMIDLLAERGGDRILSDTRELGVVDQADQQWTAVDWAPRATERGMDHLALVMPESVVSKLSVDSVIAAADSDDANDDYFDDRAEARNWIEAQ